MDDNQRVRKHTRFGLCIAAEIVVGGQKLATGALRDLSLGGLFINTEQRVPVGTECEVVLMHDEGGNVLRVSCPGTVQRADDDGLAISLEGRSDQENPLLQMVRFNYSQEPA